MAHSLKSLGLKPNAFGPQENWWLWQVEKGKWCPEPKVREAVGVDPENWQRSPILEAMPCVSTWAL